MASLIGGLSLLDQQKQLDDIPHVIVGTPGRVLQLLRTHESFQKYLKNIEYLVLDEVDRMVQTNINEDLQKILALVPGQARKVLTSATVLETDLTSSLQQALQVTSFQQISLCDAGVP